MIAAVAAWAWRLAGVGDATIGVADDAARRLLHELAPLLHVPVMRFVIDETTTFDDLRCVAAQERAGSLDHGPFLADLIGREPALIGTDVTPQVTIDLDDEDGVGESLPGQLRIGITDGEIRLTSALAPDALGRIADQLQVLLTAGSAAPTAPITDLPLLGTSEQALLDAINRTEMEFDRDATIDQLIGEQAARTPDAPALTSDGVTLTYRQLLDQVAAMTSCLAEQGVRPRDRVGIALERGIEMMVAVLATHACGAAYVPLDPTYPAERLRLMVTDSGLRTVVAEPEQHGARHGARRRRRHPPRRRRCDGNDHAARDRSRRVRPGLRDLHVRFDRHAQRRDAGAPQRRELLRRDGSGDRARPCRDVAGGDQPVVRHLGTRAALDPRARVPRRRQARRWRQGDRSRPALDLDL